MIRKLLLQVFVSSKMHRNVLRKEREAARKAICALGFAQVWDWETCGYAGPKPPMEICLKAVRNSQALVLILGRDLTKNTKKEHREALDQGIPDFIFVKSAPAKLLPPARKYLERQKKRCSYLCFSSPDELQSHIHLSLHNHFIVDPYLTSSRPTIGSQVSIAGSPEELKSRPIVDRGDR